MESETHNETGLTILETAVQEYADLLEERSGPKKKAKPAGYAAVLDSAAESAVGTPILLFNASLPDLTDEVISQLNATAPAGALTTPPPSATPAPK